MPPHKINAVIANGSGGTAATATSAAAPTASNENNDFHYDTVDNVKLKYNYHDEPHSFENSMEFLEDFNHFQFEVLETTV